MLASLTTTAVTRGWNPTVYSRLVSQLRDSTDIGEPDDILDGFLNIIVESTSNPLLFEYICTLSCDPHSFVFFPVLLDWLKRDWQLRQQNLRDFVCYVGRYASREWKLPPKYEKLPQLSDACQQIIHQVESGCQESRLLLIGLAQSVIPELIRCFSPCKNEIEPRLHRLGILINQDQNVINSHSSEQIPGKTIEATSSGDERSEAETQLAHSNSSRALRLLWLNYMLKTACRCEYNNIRRQLHLLWPGDRETVISYELCVTAFDVFASPGTNSPPKLAEPFIKKALPLLLQKLNDGAIIDSVIARVLTTLDKDIVEIVEQRCPGIRAEFGSACIDIGLCDPTVMHALHRSHTVRQPLPFEQLPSLNEVIQSPSLFLDMNPINQRDVARYILEAVRGTQNPLPRHELARLCGQMYRFELLADNLFVHISVNAFLEAICEHANVVSTIPDDDGGAALIYSDLGILMITINWLCSRYQNIEPSGGWVSEYLTRKNFLTIGELSPSYSNIMGQWVVGLFSGSGSGIADELLRPFNEIGEIIPVLLKQAVRAYRSAVIDRETLKSGLNYFIHPFSVTLFAPLVVTVLKIDLFEETHQSSTLECLIFFLNMLLQKTANDFDIAKSAVSQICKEIVRDLVACDSCDVGNFSKSASTKELTDSFVSLVEQFSQQLSIKIKTPRVDSFDLGETSSLVESVKCSTMALMNWQLTLQGVPTIPLCYQQAKSALSIDVARKLIEDVTIEQSKETYLAILIADGIWHSGRRLVDADPSSPVSQIANGMIKEFNTILHDQPKLPSVVITGNTRRDQNGSSNENEMQFQQDSVEDIAPPPPNTMELPGNNDESINQRTNRTNVPAATSMSSFDGLDGNFDNLSQPQPPVPNDFENDFVSQPMMNLADLDSAMDFNWE